MADTCEQVRERLAERIAQILGRELGSQVKPIVVQAIADVVVDALDIEVVGQVNPYTGYLDKDTSHVWNGWLPVVGFGFMEDPYRPFGALPGDETATEVTLGKDYDAPAEDEAEVRAIADSL